MKAFIFRTHGGPETQVLTEVPTPVPGPKEILVAVRAAGINPGDWKTRRGYPRAASQESLPEVFGAEVAGIVEEIGPGVTTLKVGEAVFGSTTTNGFAEHALVSAAIAARIPEGVTFTDAATLPVAAATAYDGVQQLGLRPDAVLLVTGVGGGVGVAVAQIARSRHVRVIGTASKAKRSFVEALGVVHVAYGDGVAGRVREIAAGPVDAIYDLVGGAELEAVAELLTNRRKLITAVDSAAAAQLGGGPVQRSRNCEVLEAVGRMAETGALNPHVTKAYPFDRAADALAEVEGGHARGKIVIEMSRSLCCCGLQDQDVRAQRDAARGYPGKVGSA
jgi:NADPH:quinone reductase-like Zn-dependent oxidoreductase